MIGLVGPEDSVALVLRVAAEMGVSDQVVPQAYQVPDQAPDLARDLDAVCQVILFTGRVPYAFARAAGDFSARLEFVPHSGIDLYRSLVLLLRQYGGRLPVLSIDTIEADVVAEVWRDLALAPPARMLPLAETSAEETVRGSRDIVAFHFAAWRSGSVEACLTCLRSVYDALLAHGITAFRVEHTRASVRDALTWALETSQHARAEAQQIAVGLLEIPPAIELVEADVSSQEPDTVPEELLAHLQALLHARVQVRDTRTHVVFTTWGALERLLERHPPTSRLELVPRGFRREVALGFGLGATVPRAEENARRALLLARQERVPYAVFADGSVRRLDLQVQPGALALRATDPRLLERARGLGMSAVSLQRLGAALQRLDTQALTAPDLADAMGLAQRSARRILLRLQRQGIAHPSGTDGGPGAGRPRTLYRVDAGRLLASRGLAHVAPDGE